ncbi:chordin-like isoform X2 [Dysidea avara]|uniref:chordin-like isoform X2 n=1 Tax=Dysidea avara TaxID=196820 RepID=UPI0033257B23
MMWTSLCAILFIQLSLTAAFPILQPFEDILTPFENDTTEIQSKCSTVQCPKLKCSKTILKEGECCRSCDTENTLGCLVNDKTYEELSMIPSNSSDPCEVCHCCIGEVVCSRIFQACPQLKCNHDQIVVEEGKCCPKCADENKVNLEQATCEENGITYQDGDIWNPYFPKFGVLKCQNCTCKSGKKICEKLSCPPVRECTADDPVEETTICCPKCTRVTDTTEATDNDNTYTPPSLEPTMSTSKPCSTVTHAYKVYETIDGHIDQIAIESIAIANVDVYVWSNDTVMAQYESYSSKTFTETYVNVRFRYIGNTSQELIQTVIDWFNTRKRKHSLFYCKHRCSSRVIRLLQPSDSNNLDSC